MVPAFQYFITCFLICVIYRELLGIVNHLVNMFRKKHNSQVLPPLMNKGILEFNLGVTKSKQRIDRACLTFSLCSTQSILQVVKGRVLLLGSSEFQPATDTYLGQMGISYKVYTRDRITGNSDFVCSLDHLSKNSEVKLKRKENGLKCARRIWEQHTYLKKKETNTSRITVLISFLFSTELHV